jgi:DNA-binding PadR family transcriptional regulator
MTTQSNKKKLTPVQSLLLNQISIGSQVTTSYKKGSSVTCFATLESLNKKGLITFEHIASHGAGTKTYKITSINK